MTVASADVAVPEGFSPLSPTGSFLDLLGPFFYRPAKSGFVIVVRVDEKHGNARGAAYGAFLVTLADRALGYTAAASVDPPLQVTTVSISADFGDGAAISL